MEELEWNWQVSLDVRHQNRDKARHCLRFLVFSRLPNQTDNAPASMSPPNIYRRAEISCRTGSSRLERIKNALSGMSDKAIYLMT